MRVWTVMALQVVLLAAFAATMRLPAKMDPTCSQALQQEKDLQTRLTSMEGSLQNLRQTAADVQRQCTAQVQTAPVKCESPPLKVCDCDNATLNRALYRADTCERELPDLNARIFEINHELSLCRAIP